MFNFLFKSIYEIEPKAFGLDISDLSLKAVRLEPQNNKIQLADFNETNLPTGLIEKGIIKNEKDLTKTIFEFFNKINLQKKYGRYTVISLPEQETFLRVIKIPYVEENEIENQLYREIESEIPINIPDFYIGWQIINKNKAEEKKEYFEIITAAIDKTITDQYINVIKNAGLKLKALEVESQALARSVIEKKLKSLETILIIDFGATSSGLTIFSNNSLNFTSTIPIGGQDLEKNLMNKLAVNKQEAEKLKIEIGLDRSKDNGRIFDAAKPIIDDLIQKIQDYLNYYYNRDLNNENLKIKKIFLVGGDANLIGLPAYFKQKLKIETELGNPLINVMEKENKYIPPISFNKSLKYAVAIGLALRDFDK